ncbi:MAG: HAD family hydrolase [Massiliimalia sp.]
MVQRILYVSDLDGTLLNSQTRLSEFTCKTINALVEQGMLFTYATARSLTSALPVTKGLSPNIPVIGYNGVFLFDPSGEVLHSEQFSQPQIDFLKQCLGQYSVAPLVYSIQDGKERVSWIQGTENEGIRYYLKERQGDPRFCPLTDAERLYAGQVFYITCIGNQAQLFPVYERLKEHAEYRCTFQQELYRPEYWCEIMPPKGTKAHGILHLKERWNCDKVVCFGDAINDIPMFEIADECYAVSNGVNELKTIATGVIGANDEDGVAKWLLKHAQIPGTRGTIW